MQYIMVSKFQTSFCVPWDARSLAMAIRWRKERKQQEVEVPDFLEDFN